MVDQLISALAYADTGLSPSTTYSYTVTATGGGDNQLSGGSFKIIVDTEDWDRSVGLNNPGQSGDVNSPHYRDLFALWANDRYFPVPYARAKVEARTETRLVITP